MGPFENRTDQLERQAARRQKRRSRRSRRIPRTRRCLLKGCERRFHAKHARQRYCSPECRQAARKWSEWKARLTYRATAAGKQKRNGQSRRYRKRVKERNAPQREAVREAARVISRKFFLTAAATGLAATNGSSPGRDRRCNGSARKPASAPWNVSGSASGAGEELRSGTIIHRESGPLRGSRESHEISWPY
jgi:hypothetical protein